MNNFFLLCSVFCLSTLSEVKSDIELVQPSSEIKSPGENVELSCKTSGYAFTSYWIYWIQQVPGKGLQWIGFIAPSNAYTSYSPSYQGRCHISTDNSQSTAFLQLNNLKVEDTAIYYCARRDTLKRTN
uniref:Ig-like domain-containing protein n=1 Tax=Xenopus tropicalis TaxID=8364 RepID=A0A803JJS2_XENTR